MPRRLLFAALIHCDRPKPVNENTIPDSAVITDRLAQIHEGDCIDGMRSLPAGAVDLAFADPPFNIGFSYDVYDDRLETEKYLDWSKGWIAEVYRALKPTGAFWLAIGDEYAAELKVASTDLGFHCRSWVIWYYTFGVHCKLKFTRSHAHLFHFVKDPKKFTFNNDAVRVPSARQLVYADRRANSKGRMPDDTWILRPQDLVEGFTSNEDVWYFPRVAGTFKERAGFHGCQMPEQLLGRIIRSCSQENDVVLDPFSGSSTTVAVAKKLGRQWLSFELSPEYVKLGRERLEKIAVGDLLDGAAEPKVSAPSTADGKTLHAPKKSNRKNKSSSTLSLFDDLEVSPDDTDQSMIDCFESISAGFSVDRVMADPLLNEKFQLACDQAGIDGAPLRRNRKLFSLRKAGSLAAAGIETTQRTTFSWREQSSYRFASEIAWRRLGDEYPESSLEDLLCDPQLAVQFDQLASRYAPGYRPIEYRWAAISLRDQRATIASGSSTDDSINPVTHGIEIKVDSSGTNAFDHIPSSSGCYAIIGDDDAIIFVDEVDDLRIRSSRQFGDRAVLDEWLTIFGPFTFRYAVVEAVGGARQELAARLIQRYQPAWNVLIHADNAAQ